MTRKRLLQYLVQYHLNNSNATASFPQVINFLMLIKVLPGKPEVVV